MKSRLSESFCDILPAVSGGASVQSQKHPSPFDTLKATLSLSNGSGAGFIPALRGQGFRLSNCKPSWAVLGIVVLGALVRGWYFLSPLPHSVTITPDEAVYGLQALHILKGEHSVFYWAQPYTGTFSAYLSAGLYWLFGLSRIALKIIPYLCSVGFVFLNYQLAQKVFGSRKVALAAGVLSALGTPFWNNWSSRAGSGYPEAILVGNLILLLVIKIVSRDISPGFATLTQGPTPAPERCRVPPEPPVAKPACRRGRASEGRRSLLQVPVKLKFFLLIKKPRRFFSGNLVWLLAGVALGGAPVWYANFFAGAGTAGDLFSKPWGVWGALQKLITLGFPILLGTRSSWEYWDFFLPLAVLVWLFYGVGLVSLVVERIKGLKGMKGVKGIRGRLEPVDLLLGTFFSILVVFALSAPFNQFVIEPRYVLAFYTIIPLVGGWFLIELWERGRVWGILVALLLLVNAGLGFFKAPPASFVDPYQLDHVVSLLEQKDLQYINTNGALAHRLMFMTSEGVIASVREGGLMDARYHQYHKWVLEAPRDQQAYLYFVDSPELPLMRAEIDHFVTAYEEQLIDDTFVVLYPSFAGGHRELRVDECE